MPECLISPIGNGLGVSNDRFGFKQLLIFFEDFSTESAGLIQEAVLEFLAIPDRRIFRKWFREFVRPPGIIPGLSGVFHITRQIARGFGERGRLPACPRPGPLRRSVARSWMRTEAGKMPENLIFPIGNGLGVPNDRFGFMPRRSRGSGQSGNPANPEEMKIPLPSVDRRQGDNPSIRRNYSFLALLQSSAAKRLYWL